MLISCTPNGSMNAAYTTMLYRVVGFIVLLPTVLYIYSTSTD
jgi:hypothetical protein